METLLEETANQTGEGAGSIQAGRAGRQSVRTQHAVHRQRPVGGVGGCGDSGRGVAILSH